MKFKELNIEEFKTYYVANQSKEVAIKYGIAPSTVAGWARKLDLPRKSFTYLNENIKFTDRQLDVLTGSLLGDGSLNKIKPNTNCQSHYEEGHSEDQLGWLTWKHDMLSPLSNDIFYKKRKGLINLPNGKILSDPKRSHNSYGFNTIKHPTLTEMERRWYKRNENGKYVYKISKSKKYRIKIVPEIELTPFILSVWYIDDGSKDVRTKRCKLSTQGFTKTAVESLVTKIKKLGIHDCYIGKHTGYVIYIGTYSYFDFINMVKNQLPDLPQDVQYKIDLSGYNPATKWSDNKTGIPFFRLEKGKYCGTVMINYKSIYLGSYDFKTAQKVSKEVEYLVRHKCKEPDKYIEIKNKYTNSR